MNDTPSSSQGQSSEAEAHLERLNEQVSTMRSVLVKLLQEVAVAEARIDHGDVSLLLRANEQLVVSALDAQLAADTARLALDEASRKSGLDPLTGLPNRTVLLDRFEQAISNAKRRGKRVALLFLDLDGFKQINDTHGHASGDQALRMVAACLSSLVRETDTVSRHGGDEFLVLLAEVNSAADAVFVADKVNAALAADRQEGGHVYELKASIGISVYPEDGEDARTLIARADAAMYLVKKGGVSAVSTPSRPAPEQGIQPRAGRAALDHSRQAGEVGLLEQDDLQRDLRAVNESLVLAALGAQDLLDAAQEVRRRQEALLALVVEELSDPYKPIRLAAAALGIQGVEVTLLQRAQQEIEAQAERLTGLVRQVLALPSSGLG